jgi:hypothetical protein
MLKQLQVRPQFTGKQQFVSYPLRVSALIGYQQTMYVYIIYKKVTKQYYII